MKRENVKKNIGIISAFADGKTIQILNERGEWVDLTEREGILLCAMLPVWNVTHAWIPLKALA